MGKLDTLWEYQQADQKIDALERKLKNLPARKKFFRARKTLMEQQERLGAMERMAQVGRSRTDGIEKDYKRLMVACKKLEEIFNKSSEELFQKTSDDALAQVDQFLADYNFLQQKVVGLRRELTHIMTNVDAAEKSLEDIRVIVTEARKDYNHYKDVHNAELKEATPELEGLRAAAAQESKKVDPELLKKYTAIKSNKIAQPLAEIRGDQCGGCNISLPSLVVNSVRAGERIVECESCGRILYIPDGK